MNLHFIKTFLIYSGSGMLNKLIPFLLLPIITKYLTPQEYGVYGMYQVVLSFLMPFVGMSLQTNITRNFFKVNAKILSKIIASLLLILHLHVFVALLAISFITFIWHNPFGFSSQFLYIIPLIIYVQMINIFNLTILRNEERALQYGIIEIALTFMHYTSAIFLLLFLKFSWMSLVYGTLIAHTIVAFYSLYYYRKTLQITFGNFYSFKEIYIISTPLIFHTIGGSIIFLSDRIFIEKMLNVHSVGLYMIAAQFGMITMIVLDIVVMTINPWIYKSLANHKNIIKEIYLLMVSYVFIGIFIWLISYMLFPHMVDKTYFGAQSIILWISLGYIVRGWYQIFHAIIVHEGKTKILMYITMTAGGVNLVFNYILISLNGINGAAQATLIAFVTMFLLTLYYVKNKLTGYV